MEIKKVYQENLPTVKLTGKRYTSADRDETGTFASHWQQFERYNSPRFTVPDEKGNVILDICAYLL